MIGLRRGTVKLVPHTKAWAREFEREKKRLTKKLEKRIVAVEHIGSTSIPGILAKPIIDISVGIRSMKNSKTFIKPMRELGYELRKNFGGHSL